MTKKKCIEFYTLFITFSFALRCPGLFDKYFQFIFSSKDAVKVYLFTLFWHSICVVTHNFLAQSQEQTYRRENPLTLHFQRDKMIIINELSNGDFL